MEVILIWSIITIATLVVAFLPVVIITLVEPGG